MKILTGSLRGRVIPFRPEPGLRPTADKVRKALIDLFAGWIEGRRVLDLYSGTGAFGMEFLSAGASFATFVEHDPSRARRIQAWLSEASLTSASQVLTADVRQALDRRLSGSYDLVVMDPPYADQDLAHVLARSAALLAEGGFLAYECRASHEPPDVPGLEKIRDKIYGDTRLAVYRKPAG